MALSWYTKRKVIIISILLIPVLVYVALYLVSNYEPPTCFDGKRNGGEQGVDCGGGCKRVCTDDVSGLAVLFTRAFKTSDGVYNVLAQVENTNRDIWSPRARYIFNFYNENDALIHTEQGETFIPVLSEFFVFEGPIRLDEAPARIEFVFETGIVWEKAERPENVLVVQNQRLTNAGVSPRLTAVVENDGFLPIEDIEVIAVIKRDNEPIATSRTFIDYLEDDAVQGVTFTWPEQSFIVTEVGQCASPLDAVLVIDRSGSMNDDSENPPQPITDVKNAASGFVEGLENSDRAGVVSFATEASNPVDSILIGNKNSVIQAIDAISITAAAEVGSTNLGDALDKATSLLSSPRFFADKEVPRTIIALTDGRANAPEEPGGEIYAEDKANRAKLGGITLYIIGLGDEVNTSYLERIATSPRHYYGAASRSVLSSIYANIADEICEYETKGPTVVEIYLRTPDIYR